MLGRAALVCSLCCGGCAAAPAPAPAPVGGVTTQPVSLRLPVILPAEPARPHLDLGPVLAQSDRRGAGRDALLLAQADALRADGFVFEARAIIEVYGIDWSRDAAWRDAHPTLSFAADVGRWLLTGDLGLLGDINAPLSKTQTGYFRAFRYFEGEPAPVPVATLPLTEELRPWMERATTRRGQLAVAHGLLAHGAVDRERYESLRRALIVDGSVTPPSGR